MRIWKEMMKSSCRYLVVLLLLCSCSASRSKVSDLPEYLRGAALSIDVFSARGFLGGSEYERYYLDDGVMWRECGSVKLPSKKEKKKGALEGDEVFARDTTLEIRERRVEKLSDEQQSVLKLKSSKLSQLLSQGKPRPALPGAFYSLSQPGLLELKLRLGEEKALLVTSVDEIADGESQVVKSARELVETIRGIGPVICGADTFYGISRVTLK